MYYWIIGMILIIGTPFLFYFMRQEKIKEYKKIREADKFMRQEKIKEYRKMEEIDKLINGINYSWTMNYTREYTRNIFGKIKEIKDVNAQIHKMVQYINFLTAKPNKTDKDMIENMCLVYDIIGSFDENVSIETLIFFIKEYKDYDNKYLPYYFKELKLSLNKIIKEMEILDNSDKIAMLYKHIENATESAVDPQELDPKLYSIFKEATQLANKKTRRSKRYIGFCHHYWGIKKEILKKEFNIDWKSPGEMNPYRMYD